MASDYKQICEDNILRRGTDFDDIGAFLAEKLYGDRSHFIYELLQNAEDALALRKEQEGADVSGTVTFRVYADRLEVSHFGKLFDEEDVRGVSDVLRGTKLERNDQIGTFGIGFKSVYVFTTSPEIHSGDEHFRIKHYIRPEAVDPRETLADETLFYFPFNHRRFKKSQSRELIEVRLKDLGLRSMLFLEHVNELAWSAGRSSLHSYKRISSSLATGGTRVDLVEYQGSKEISRETWLVFSRPVKLPKSSCALPVKVAFRLVAKSHRKDFRVLPLNRSPLNVYFPTERETNLGFLIHGPFAPTPARDNIEHDNLWNLKLIQELSKLLVESLDSCKEAGFLTPTFLKCLPINEDHFPEGTVFRPFYDAVLKVFRRKPLIPTCENEIKYVSAERVFLSRSKDIRKILAPEELAALFGKKSPRYWAHETITENTNEVWHYLRYKCGIRVVDGENIASHIDVNFLKARDDEWMIRFYQFLAGQEALWRERQMYRPRGPLRTKPIIRCEDGVHRPPFDEAGDPIVYLPYDSDSSFPVVKKSIYEDDRVRDFFAALGLVVPDLCATVLSTVLPKYTDEIEISQEEHHQDVNLILSALNLEESPQFREMLKTLRRTPWSACRNAGTGAFTYETPRDAYLPTETLKMFFEGNEDIVFVAEDHFGTDSLRQLGVKSVPKVFCRGLELYKSDPYDCLTLSDHWGWHERGLYCFDPETDVEGIKFALDHITLPRAVYIWNKLLPQLVPFLEGTVRKSTRQDFTNAISEEKDSILGKRVKKKEWVPTRDGGFITPASCTVDQLHPELEQNAELIKALNVKPDPKETEQKEIEHKKNWIKWAGLDEDMADYLVSHRNEIDVDTLKKALELHRNEKATYPQFPERASINPDRREKKVRERISNANDKEYHKRQRSVKVTSPSQDQTVWLTHQYTNVNDQMICQMCKREMPFKLRNTGIYYFEAVQVSDDLRKDDHAVHLALCPLCAAKYKFLVKKDTATDALENFLSDLRASENLEVSIDLGEEQATIRFVETHFLEFRAALEEMSAHKGKAESRHSV